MTNVFPIDLRCEYLTEPLGIDSTRPRLFWRLHAPHSARAISQSAYQILCASTSAFLSRNEGDLWDTGRVASNRTIQVPYAGTPVSSGQRVFWKVRIWDRDGKPSEWSEPSWWEAGLLERSDWQAQWIGPQPRPRDASQPAPMLRRNIAIGPDVLRARLYVAARGLCRPFVNGGRVGNDELSPGWSSYNRRVQYVTYDVTDSLEQGTNAIGLLLGDGWYCGYLADWHSEGRGFYGQDPQVLAQLVIHYADGSSTIIGTDDTWRWSTGAIRSSDIYNGEIYDARLQKPGWAAPGFDDSAWAPVEVYPDQGEKRTGKKVEPVQCVDTLSPTAMTEPEAGMYIFDFGQNMVGRVRLSISGKAGQTVTMRHAEVLENDGRLYTKNLRKAAQTDQYTFAENGRVHWEPTFTFHGFRYVELTGLDTSPSLDAVTGVVMHNAMQPTGEFECSDPRINQLQHNIVWGQKGNYLEVPTDCPQRDERLGWTGYAQVFIRTACHNFNVAPFIHKWMDDLTDDQGTDGSVPHVAPDVLQAPDGETIAGGAAAWADAVIIVPWTLYRCFGDNRILQDHYEAMTQWIAYQEATSRQLIRPAEGFGDWLAMDHPGTRNDQTATPKDLVGTAYFAYTSRLMATIASILNRNDDAKRFEALSERVRKAFQREFVTPNGRIVGDTQTVYSLALNVDLLPADKRVAAGDRIAADVHAHDNHITTGFVGANQITFALTETGHVDSVYNLLFQDTCPSWLFPVTQGATTIWERWDGWTPERGWQDPGMNSFNHYAYGAIGEWLYTVCAGLNVDEQRPGFGHILFEPIPDFTHKRLTYAGASCNTLHGIAAIRWDIDDNDFRVSVTLPPNTKGTLRLPTDSTDNLLEHDEPASESEGVSRIAVTNGKVTVDLQSGAYTFKCPCDTLSHRVMPSGPRDGRRR
ncbi:MAG: glycoside hydrolase family 78 protein [Candidatus Pacebacteria bacterium]|nr:glycoside hydrolase family 78 protein [Candidatus Paceibacterota bacterium]